MVGLGLGTEEWLVLVVDVGLAVEVGLGLRVEVGLVRVSIRCGGRVKVRSGVRVRNGGRVRFGSSNMVEVKVGSRDSGWFPIQLQSH